MFLVREAGEKSDRSHNSSRGNCSEPDQPAWNVSRRQQNPAHKAAGTSHNVARLEAFIGIRLERTCAPNSSRGFLPRKTSMETLSLSRFMFSRCWHQRSSIWVSVKNLADSVERPALTTSIFDNCYSPEQGTKGWGRNWEIGDRYAR